MLLLTCVFVLQFYFTRPHLKKCVEPFLYFEFTSINMSLTLSYIYCETCCKHLKTIVYFYLKVKGVHFIYKLLVNSSNDLIFSITFTFKHV